MSGRILDRVDSPRDLKGLGREELSLLAQEIRDFVIETVAETGGHLASSLGVVELTIALHYVFDSPRDKIIWDVGHQAYVHKILTGRKDRFHTLRQMGGISGFPKRGESPHDIFGTGHSSTSISAALGIAAARDMRGENFHVIAVIGDGSISSGVALEGLNQAGHLNRDLIVILNDNEWSISQNVGALSAYLNRIMTGRFYTSVRRRVEKFLKSIPYTGDLIAKLGRRFEELAKGLIVPGLLFEELGFTYVGPIPGHNLDDLIVTLNNVKKFDGPVLVHVVTTKGKGYRFAEENPEKFHGVSPFDVATGKPKKKKTLPSYTEVFADEIVRIGEECPDVVAITAAMPGGTGLEKFARHFPDRFFDVGISESHGIIFAAGLATEGKIPVAAIYSTFLQRAYDQIVHDVALQNLHVVFVLDRGGIVGADGPTHHGLFDLSYLRHVPNMTVMAPADEKELVAMLRAAIKMAGPVAIRYPRGEAVGVGLDGEVPVIERGKGRLLREGNDLTIVAVGAPVHPAAKAAERLEREEGVSVEVIDSRFVKPLDEELIVNSARKTKRVLTVEENVLIGGFGSGILEILSDRRVRGVEVMRLGVGDTFLEHGTQAELRRKVGIDEEGIFRASLALLGGEAGGMRKDLSVRYGKI